MTLWLIPASGSGKRSRLIDRSFRPSFYVHGPEPRLRHLARALAARAHVSCTLTRREDIWEARELVVLEITAHHPTQFEALARFASRFDPGLRLYNSDLMLPPMYCWEKGVFPLAKVDVEVGGCTGSQAEFGTRDSGLAKQRPFIPNPACDPAHPPTSTSTLASGNTPFSQQYIGGSIKSEL